MKKILMFAASLMMGVAVYAQPPGGGMGGPPPGMMGEGQSVTISDPAVQAQEFVDKIKDELNLSEKQQKSLVKLYTNHFSKLQTLKAQISDLEKYTEQRLTTEILSTEQATEWKEVKKKVKVGSENDSNNRGNGNFGDFMPGMMPPMMM